MEEGGEDGTIGGGERRRQEGEEKGEVGGGGEGEFFEVAGRAVCSVKSEKSMS